MNLKNFRYSVLGTFLISVLVFRFSFLSFNKGFIKIGSESLGFLARDLLFKPGSQDAGRPDKDQFQASFFFYTL